MNKGRLFLISLTSAVVMTISTTLATGGVEGLIGWLTGEDGAKIIKTSLVYTRPFDFNGKVIPPFRAKVHDGASCTPMPSMDASIYRCFNSDGVWPHCWVDYKTAFCLSAPWESEVGVMSLKEQPDVDPEISRADEPWAMEIEEPGSARKMLKCTAIYGGGYWVAGQRANWACVNDKGVDRGYALGDPKRATSAPWQIYFVPDGKTETVQVQIKTVWA
ncbi:hypothetical protein [Streptomyces sp. 039-1]|uniref:hypothetical protein n=1 Tax=Streptomyces sp. 039-1 TaxID=2789263 RepID=UPI0039F54CA1